MRPGYAVEYDYSRRHNFCRHSKRRLSVDFICRPSQGTSGYEEAAAQGLIAGANAALKIETDHL